ncbi:hypothetical protein JCM13591A_31240 [Microbacterium xylanilyticum]
MFAAIGLMVGVGSAQGTTWAVLLGLGALFAAVSVLDLSLIPVVAVPATMVMDRVGPMSISDFVLGGATVIALLLLRGKGAAAMQPLLWAGAIYMALTAPQLILNPYLGNAIEWAHELVLVVGSMVVGFVIGRDGRARLALSSYALIGCGIAATTIVVAFQEGFGPPVYLGMLHKNAIGGILMVAALIVFANPPWLRWRPVWGYAAFALCGGGILAAQSRQAIIGLLIGVVIIGSRPRHHNGKRSRWIWLALVPAAYFVYVEVTAQLADSADAFNSSAQRLAWYADSITVWKMSPLFGVGHRWWVAGYTGFSGFQPPNAELEVLTTVGIVGLVGFLLMFGASMWLTARMDPAYGTLAFAVIAARLVQGQFDLYWVAGQSSILWIIAGICYGVRERNRAQDLVWVPHPVQTLFRRSGLRNLA